MKYANLKIRLLTISLLMVIIGSLVFLSSCHEPTITKLPSPTQDQPDVVDEPGEVDSTDIVVHNPDTLIHKEDTLVLGDSNKKSMKVSWSDLDYKLYTFNDKNQLEKYHYQYVFVQNDPTQIKSFDYQFTYDGEGRLTESLYNNSFKTIFEYTNGILSGAKEYNGYNEISEEYQFVLNQEGRLIEMEVKSFVSGFSQRKYTYKYVMGNLVEMKQYYLEGDRYQLSLTFEWEGFDNYSFQENYTAFSPYIPSLKFWNNNPGKRTVRDKNGRVTGAIENYFYSYDNNGLVSSKTKQVVLDKIYPSTTQYYDYKNF